MPPNADYGVPPHGSASTYKHHGCRCDECRAAATEYMRKMRRQETPPSVRARSIATGLATAWVIKNHPRVWQAFLHQGYERIGGRGKSGPKASRNDGSPE